VGRPYHWKILIVGLLTFFLSTVWLSILFAFDQWHNLQEHFTHMLKLAAAGTTYLLILVPVWLPLFWIWNVATNSATARHGFANAAWQSTLATSSIIALIGFVTLIVYMKDFSFALAVIIGLWLIGGVAISCVLTQILFKEPNKSVKIKLE
jgi:hypothetical protein